MLALRPGDQVAQVTVLGDLDQPEVAQPEIVVHLRDVARAGVAGEGHHALRGLLRAAVTQRGGEQRAGRGAGVDAFLEQQLAGSGEGLGVRDRVGDLGHGEVADRRDEVLTDALDQPGAALLVEHALVHPLREDRPHRIGQHELDLRRDLLEVGGQAADRAGGAHAEHDRVEVMTHLLPDLGRGGLLVGGGVVGVEELVDVVPPVRLGERGGEVLVVLGMAAGHVGARQHHLGTHRATVVDLLRAHLVGDDEHQLVALLRRDQCQAEAGVTGGRFDDGGARLEVAAALGAFDHLQRHAVLDRTAGIRRLELQEQTARPDIEVVDLDHRGAPDHLEYGAMDLHG